jgi:putative ABC transport system substrate-binding protein
LKRRAFIAGICGVAMLTPRAGSGQAPNRLRRVGVLMHLAENTREGQLRVEAFRGSFEKLGWSDGRNVNLSYRWAAGSAELAKQYAVELAGSSPDILLAGNSQVCRALQQATKTIPIVFAEVIDPIGNGLVAGLTRPGGNITGFTMFETSLAAKWLELLKQIAPNVVRAGVIYDPATPSSPGFLAAVEGAAPSFGVQLSSAAIGSAADVENFFGQIAAEPDGGIIVFPGSSMSIHRKLITENAATRRLPVIYGLRDNPVNGGLASYGVDSVDLYRQAATYVDRILRGETPGSLPVQAATRFELVINLKTAKALGLEISPALLGRADEVIE